MKSFKIILGIIFSIVVFYSVQAQSLSGTVKYKVSHNWIRKIAAIDYISQREKERYEYIWGNNPTYVEKTVLYFSDNKYRYEETGEFEARFSSNYSRRNDEYIKYRDLNDMRYYDLIRMLGKLYVIEDSISYQNWKILNDMREIAGHICMSASFYDTLKNNKIIAWFALDIPMQAGPERFGGLPGMILEIDINDGALVIEAESVDFFDHPDGIQKPEHKRRVRKINEEEYLELLSNHIQNRQKAEQPYFYGIRY